MASPTYLSYFAGGDLAGCGLRAAGYAWGREDKRPYVKPDGSVGR